MHLTQVAFLAIFLATLTAAYARGGRPERQGGALLLAAALVTPLVQLKMFNDVELGIAAVDTMLLAALTWLAVCSERRWPIFAAASQAAAVLTHIARFKAGPVHGDAYGNLLVFWSYPVALSLLWGSLIEGRRKAGAVTVESSPTRTPPAGPPVTLARDPKSLAMRGDDVALLTQLLTLHGLGRESAKIASDLIQRAGSFAAAVAATPARLQSWGLDNRVAEALAFTRQTTRTSLKRKLEARVKVDDIRDTVDYLHSEMAHLPHEQFRVLYLNARNRLVHDEVHGIGTVNQAAVYPREVIKRAVEVGAVGLILAHNHPSGDPSPSRDDVVMTRVIVEAGRHIGITVIDHFVIGVTGHVSMKGTGLI
ncbi:JAB domain-containing protein [Sandarakinorhabdus sp. DWP1-3-1]|uniref:JAB domain-containing protein n=1 Tax=Sandarakinorhabdus sp. DWP1-3-1 TaxID=2804627 RepID=UPI003CF9E96E